MVHKMDDDTLIALADTGDDVGVAGVHSRRARARSVEEKPVVTTEVVEILRRLGKHSLANAVVDVAPYRGGEERPGRVGLRDVGIEEREGVLAAERYQPIGLARPVHELHDGLPRCDVLSETEALVQPRKRAVGGVETPVRAHLGQGAIVRLLEVHVGPRRAVLVAGDHEFASVPFAGVFARVADELGPELAHRPGLEGVGKPRIRSPGVSPQAVQRVRRVPRSVPGAGPGVRGERSAVGPGRLGEPLPVVERSDVSAASS